MIVLLLRIIFFAINTILNLILRIIFTTSGHLLVLIIQAIRVPGEAAQGALQQIAEGIKTCFETILQLIMEAISNIISSGFDLLVEGISGSVSVTGSAVGSLLEKTATSLDGLLKDHLPEIAEEFADMISSLVTDLWNNYKDALGYVTENA